MEIRKVEVAKLKPFPGNPRQHGVDIGYLVKSIKKFGWTNPIIIQKGTYRIIAGHGRALAALKAGIKKVPVIELSMDDRDAAAYSITDNRLAELSSWDYPKLKDILSELNDGEFDLDLVSGEDWVEEVVTYDGKGPEPGTGDDSQEEFMVKCPKCSNEFTPKVGKPRKGK